MSAAKGFGSFSETSIPAADCVAGSPCVTWRRAVRNSQVGLKPLSGRSAGVIIRRWL